MDNEEVKLCCFCKKDLNITRRTTMSNPDLDDVLQPEAWIYMPKAEKCHFECYIRECFKEFQQEELRKYKK